MWLGDNNQQSHMGPAKLKAKRTIIHYLHKNSMHLSIRLTDYTKMFCLHWWKKHCLSFVSVSQNSSTLFRILLVHSTMFACSACFNLSLEIYVKRLCWFFYIYSLKKNTHNKAYMIFLLETLDRNTTCTFNFIEVTKNNYKHNYQWKLHFVVFLF